MTPTSTVEWIKQVGEFAAIDVEGLIEDQRFVDAAEAVLATSPDPMRQFMALRDFVFGQVGIGCAIPLSVRRQTVAKAPSLFDVPTWALDGLRTQSNKDLGKLTAMRYYASTKIPEEGTSVRLFSTCHLGDRSRTNMRRSGMIGGRAEPGIITGWRAVTVPDKSESINNIALRIIVNHQCYDDVLARFIVDGAPTLIYVPANASFDVEVDVYRSHEIEPVMLFVVIEGWLRREVE